MLMRQTFGQIMLDVQKTASMGSLAQTVDLAVASRLSHQVLIASADLANVTEAAVGDPGLHGSTRCLLHQQREMQGEEISLISPDQG
ncbi:hypothetical protein BH23ACT6_BH23ACT6_21770 [soil metagenome]